MKTLPAPAFSRRAFGGFVVAAASAASCSAIFDPQSYDRGQSGDQDGSPGKDAKPNSSFKGALLVGGVLDGFNQGTPTKEVFLVQTDANGIVTGFKPQLQVLYEARRYTARVEQDQVLAACPGGLLQSQLGTEGVSAWRGNDLPNPPGDEPVFVFAGPWLVAIAGTQVSILKFGETSATWQVQTNHLMSARREPSVTYVNKRLYVLGGATPDQRPRMDGEYAAFDESKGTTGSFAAMPSLPASPFGCGFVASGNQLYAVGGNNDAAIINQTSPHDRVFASALASDGAPGPWREQPALITPLADASTWVQGGRIYVAAGRRGGNNPSSVLVGSTVIGADGNLGAWDFQSHARLALGRFLAFAVVL